MRRTGRARWTPYSDRDGRDWEDNDIRFARFALVSTKIAAGLVDPSWAADLVHVNDWPASLVPGYVPWMGYSLPSILTIHNLASQGLFQYNTLARIGAPEQSFNINELEFYDKVSFLKAGIVHATHQ